MAAPKTPDGMPRITIEPTQGTKVTFISPNWCNKTTWYQGSEKIAGHVLNVQTPGMTYSAPGVWVDNFHGRYSDEDLLLTQEGFIPRLKVYVDGVEKTEVDPHTNSGDYTVDYSNGSVTFSPSISTESVVTADIFSVVDSTWVLAPDPGKHLKVTKVEAQFSLDVHVTDSIVFQPYGFVDVFAPHLVGAIPSGTKIPLGSPKRYKTMMDYVNESTGALPLIKAPSGGTNTWRDLPGDVQIFPWDYIASTELKSSWGMEVRIYLEHHTPFTGTVATATFYCLSEEDE